MTQNSINNNTFQDVDVDEAVHHIAKTAMPSIIDRLLREQKLDENKLTDKKYVWSTVMSNLKDILGSLTAVHAIDESFLRSAQEAIQTDRPAVAIVLIATAIEHKLNRFYRETLELEKGFSSEEATVTLRKSTIRDKIGKLMRQTTGSSMPESLKKRIQQIATLRNNFVHYKAPVTLLDDMDDEGYGALRQQVDTIGLENMFHVPYELDTFLETTFYALSPTAKKAHEIAQKMFSKNR